MTPDPLAVHAPGEADLNLYAYVSGRVLAAVDPFGLDETTLSSDSNNETDQEYAEGLVAGNSTPSGYVHPKGSAAMPERAAPETAPSGRAPAGRGAVPEIADYALTAGFNAMFAGPASVFWSLTEDTSHLAFEDPIDRTHYAMSLSYEKLSLSYPEPASQAADNADRIAALVGLGLGFARAPGLALMAEGENTVRAAAEASRTARAGTKSVEQAGSELAAEAGRNRVSASTAGGKQIDIDLAGKAHFDKASGQRVPTPHVRESKINVGPGGQTNLSDKKVRAATMDDIRTARKVLERE